MQNWFLTDWTDFPRYIGVNQEEWRKRMAFFCSMNHFVRIFWFILARKYRKRHLNMTIFFLVFAVGIYYKSNNFVFITEQSKRRASEAAQKQLLYVKLDKINIHEPKRCGWLLLNRYFQSASYTHRPALCTGARAIHSDGWITKLKHC